MRYLRVIKKVFLIIGIVILFSKIYVSINNDFKVFACTPQLAQSPTLVSPSTVPLPGNSPTQNVLIPVNTPTTNVNLSWNPVGSWGDACQEPTIPPQVYHVYLTQDCVVNLSTDPVANLVTPNSTTSTNLTLSNLAANHSYCYIVSSDNGLGNSNSTLGSFLVCQVKPPNAPLIASPSAPNNPFGRLTTQDVLIDVNTPTSNINVSWNPIASWGNACKPVTPPQVYHVYKTEGCKVDLSTNPSGNLVNPTSTTATNLTLFNLASNQSYCYIVSSDNGAGNNTGINNSQLGSFHTCQFVAPSGQITSPSPTNTLVIGTNNTTLTWSPPQSWGGYPGDSYCGSNNIQYEVYLSPTCNNNYIDMGSTTTQSYNLTNLQWGTSYCWQILGSNNIKRLLKAGTVNPPTPEQDYIFKTFNVASGISSFRVINTPVITSFRVGDPANYNITCKYNNSGNFNQAGTSNPLTFNVNYTDVDFQATGLTFKEVWFAMEPVNSGISGSVVAKNAIDVSAGSSGSIVSRIDIPSKTLNTLKNSAPFNQLDSGVGSGNDLNAANTATVLNFGNSPNPTSVIVAGNNLSANFTIRFENTFPSGQYYLYTGVIFKTSDGQLISSYETGSLNQNYYNSYNGTWGVYTNPLPQITLPTYQFVTKSSFNLNTSFIDSGGPGISASDISTQIYITPKSYTLTGPINPSPQVIGSTPVNFNMISGSGVNTIWPGSATFNNLTNNVNSQITYNINLSILDNACNKTVINGFTVSTSPPWVTSYLGNIYTKLSIISPTIPGVYTPIPSVTPLIVNNQSFYSTYEAISGGNGLPLATTQGSVSQQYETLSNYINNALNPPDGGTSWYKYFQNLINSNNNSASPINISQTSGNNIANLLAVNPELPDILIAQATGNLTLTANTVCNDRAIIFIAGNLNIYPNITNATKNDACIYIVKGNINILNTLTSNVPLVSALSAPYETISGEFVTDSTFITNPSSTNPTDPNKEVGLLVIGGVTANSLNLQRDLNYTANNGQPAEIFQYDPKYREIFRDMISNKQYSLREVTN